MGVGMLVRNGARGSRTCTRKRGSGINRTVLGQRWLGEKEVRGHRATITVDFAIELQCLFPLFTSALGLASRPACVTGGSANPINESATGIIVYNVLAHHTCTVFHNELHSTPLFVDCILSIIKIKRCWASISSMVKVDVSCRACVSCDL